MPRKHHPRHQKNNIRLLLVVLLLVLSVGTVVTVSVSSYQTGTLDRGMDGFTVTSDDRAGVVGLNIVSEVRSNNVDRLVTVQNNLDSEDLTVTLELQENARDHMVFDESGENTVTYTLSPGDEVDVFVDLDGGVHNDVEVVDFSTSASNDQTGLSVFMDRGETDVIQPGGSTGPNCSAFESDGDLSGCAGASEGNGNRINVVWEAKDDAEMLDSVTVEAIDGNRVIDSEQTSTIDSFEDAGEITLRERGQNTADFVRITIITTDGRTLVIEANIDR